MPVQNGGRAGGGAGSVDQDSSDGAAVHTAAVDAAQEAQGGHGVHIKGQRKEDGHAGGGGQTGQGANDDAQQGAEGDHQNAVQIGIHLKAGKNIS